MKTTKTQKATKASKTSTPRTPAPTPAPKPVAPKPPAAPAVTKKSICVELVSRPGGATLDEMAQAIADRGICDDLKVNRTTASLWMRKIGFEVVYEKDSKTYRKA
jgi:hypothetical protein